MYCLHTALDKYELHLVPGGLGIVTKVHFPYEWTWACRQPSAGGWAAGMNNTAAGMNKFLDNTSLTMPAHNRVTLSSLRYLKGTNWWLVLHNQNTYNQCRSQDLFCLLLKHLISLSNGIFFYSSFQIAKVGT